jgi:hypothetical protein
MPQQETDVHILRSYDGSVRYEDIIFVVDGRPGRCFTLSIREIGVSLDTF